MYPGGMNPGGMYPGGVQPMGRLAASWALVKASWGVLRSDKQLIVFPLVSGMLCVIVTVSFFIPMFFTDIIAQAVAGEQSARIVSYVVLFLFYLVQYFVIFFCNSALVGAALMKLDGRQATVGDGFRIASSRIGSIFGYSLIAATVGVILQVLRDQAKIPLARIVVALIGAAWNIATYLVVPVLVVEGVGPITGVKRSTALLKRTWGEQLAGNFGIGLVFGLLTFLVAILGVGLIVGAAITGVVALIIAAIAVTVVAVLVMILIGNTLGGIYRAAVYRYAASGQISAAFNPALVQGAFRPAARSRIRI